MKNITLVAKFYGYVRENRVNKLCCDEYDFCLCRVTIKLFIWFENTELATHHFAKLVESVLSICWEPSHRGQNISILCDVSSTHTFCDKEIESLPHHVRYQRVTEPSHRVIRRVRFKWDFSRANTYHSIKLMLQLWSSHMTKFKGFDVVLFVYLHWTVFFSI